MLGVLPSTESVLALGRDTTRVGILLVQFSDYQVNTDARACFGYSAPSAADTIENKYRFEDYWNIFFQASGPVLHPDGDFPDNWAKGQRGFNQYGSLSNYIDDNSYGKHAIIPYQEWSEHSGLLNHTLPGGTVVPLTLDYSKASFTSILRVADSAILLADQQYTINWDSLDVVIVLFAGVNPFGIAKAGSIAVDPTKRITYAVSSERTESWGGQPAKSLFLYPSVVFHEFLHAAFSALDLHTRSDWPNVPDVTGVGHFSPMGDNAPYTAYTPPMLDPWHRLTYGWLRYYTPNATFDTLNLVVPIDTLAFGLPIVEQKFNGGAPYVLVIPMDRHSDTSDFFASDYRCVIVENRRAIAWDSVVAIDEDLISATKGQRLGDGGFLVWGVENWNRFGPAWVYEADNGFESWDTAGWYGSPRDLYGYAGPQEFALWSSPSVFARPDSYGLNYINSARNIYLKFPSYSTASNVNEISRLVIDQFVPSEHAYAGDMEDDQASTKYSAQQKVDVRPDRTLATYHTAAGQAFVTSGSYPEEQREAVWLNRLIGSQSANINNTAIGTYSGSDLAASYVWQMEYPDGYDVEVRLGDKALDKLNSLGTKKFGRFDQPPHPVIATKRQFGVLAFAGDDGIYVSTSKQGGRYWSDAWKLPGSAAGSKNPAVIIDESMTDTMFVVVYTDITNRVMLYQKSSGHVAVISNGAFQEACGTPTLARLGAKLSTVYRYHDRNDNTGYIARCESNLSDMTTPRDYDAFGLRDQTSLQFNRDPVALYTDLTDPDRFSLCWIYGDGEKLLSTARKQTGKEPYEGYESILSTRTTSYPHLIQNAPGNPKFIVSRSGSIQRTGQGGLIMNPDTLPSLIVMSRQEDLDANPNILRLETELGMNFIEASSRLMHLQLGTPVVVHSYDTMAIAHYDYEASKDFTTEPVDTLTRTTVFGITDQDAALFTLDVTCDQTAADTIVFESFLVEASSGNVLSSSGEIKLAPFIGDSIMTVGLELPYGYPPSDCHIATSMSRGYYSAGNAMDLYLTRYMLFNDVPMPKRSRREATPVPVANGIQVYPQPARDEIRFVVEGPENATVTLTNLLGRRLREVSVTGNGKSTHGRMGLEGLVPGMYILVVQSERNVRTAKVVIVR
jgi:hypothetical protein